MEIKEKVRVFLKDKENVLLVLLMVFTIAIRLYYFFNVGAQPIWWDEGDYLAILDAGAYGYTMSSPYNSRPQPAEILINNGDSYLVRKAETYDDLLNNQIIPDHLD